MDTFEAMRNDARGLLHNERFGAFLIFDGDWGERGGGNEMFGFIKYDHNSRIVYGPMANKNVCIVAVLVSLN